MIERIRGILAEKSPTFVVVDVNGVGYGVNISAYTAGKLPAQKISPREIAGLFYICGYGNLHFSAC